jgi:hypothetical protein
MCNLIPFFLTWKTEWNASALKCIAYTSALKYISKQLDKRSQKDNCWIYRKAYNFLSIWQDVNCEFYSFLLIVQHLVSNAVWNWIKAKYSYAICLQLHDVLSPQRPRINRALDYGLKPVNLWDKLIIFP